MSREIERKYMIHYHAQEYLLSHETQDLSLGLQWDESKVQKK